MPKPRIPKRDDQITEKMDLCLERVYRLFGTIDVHVHDFVAHLIRPPTVPLRTNKIYFAPSYILALDQSEWMILMW